MGKMSNKTYSVFQAISPITRNSVSNDLISNFSYLLLRKKSCDQGSLCTNFDKNWVKNISISKRKHKTQNWALLYIQIFLYKIKLLEEITVIIEIVALAAHLDKSLLDLKLWYTYSFIAIYRYLNRLFLLLLYKQKQWVGEQRAWVWVHWVLYSILL